MKKIDINNMTLFKEFSDGEKIYYNGDPHVYNLLVGLEMKHKFSAQSNIFIEIEQMFESLKQVAYLEYEDACLFYARKSKCGIYPGSLRIPLLVYSGIFDIEDSEKYKKLLKEYYHSNCSENDLEYIENFESQIKNIFLNHKTEVCIEVINSSILF